MDKLPRHATEEDRAELKAATRHSLRVAKATAFAQVTRVDEAQLSKYGSLAHGESFMPVDVLADLQGEFGRGVASPLLEALARQAGFRLVPLEDDGGEGESLGVDDVTSQIKESSEANIAALRAVNSTCLHTVRDAKREAAEAIEQQSRNYRKLVAHETRLLRRAG